jgi:hypothetical protein
MGGGRNALLHSKTRRTPRSCFGVGGGSEVRMIIGSKVDEFTIIFTSLPTHLPCHANLYIWVPHTIMIPIFVAHPGAFIAIIPDQALCLSFGETYVSSIWASCPIIHLSTFCQGSVYPRLLNHCLICPGSHYPCRPPIVSIALWAQSILGAILVLPTYSVYHPV